MEKHMDLIESRLSVLDGLRKDVDELQEKGILKGKPGEVSSSVVHSMEALQSAMLHDTLNKQLSQRPALEELLQTAPFPC